MATRHERRTLKLARGIMIEPRQDVVTVSCTMHAAALSEVPQIAEKVHIVAPLPFKNRASNGMARFSHLLAEELAKHGCAPEVVCQVGASRVEGANYGQVESWTPDARPFVSILRTLRERSARNVNVHHEMYLYGRLRHNIGFVAFLAVAKLAGMRVTTTMHHAVDARNLGNAFASKAELPWLIFRGLGVVASIFNTVVALLSRAVVVHTPGALAAFPRILLGRVHVIPLIISREKTTISERARVCQKYDLQKPFVMTFGYISRYKGIEHLLDAAEVLAGDVEFVVAGGKNVRQTGKLEYEEYVRGLRERARRSGAHWLEYIPEEDVLPLFESCQALVLPYLGHFAASGPLAIAVAQQVPAILSNRLGIPEFAGVACEPTGSDIARCIMSCVSDPHNRMSVLAAGQEYARKRSSHAVAAAYRELLATPKKRADQ